MRNRPCVQQPAEVLRLLQQIVTLELIDLEHRRQLGIQLRKTFATIFLRFPSRRPWRLTIQRCRRALRSSKPSCHRGQAAIDLNRPPDHPGAAHVPKGERAEAAMRCYAPFFAVPRIACSLGLAYEHS
jgi:hypothetical protein